MHILGNTKVDEVIYALGKAASSRGTRIALAGSSAHLSRF